MQLVLSLQRGCDAGLQEVSKSTPVHDAGMSGVVAADCVECLCAAAAAAAFAVGHGIVDNGGHALAETTQLVELLWFAVLCGGVSEGSPPDNRPLYMKDGVTEGLGTIPSSSVDPVTSPPPRCG